MAASNLGNKKNTTFVQSCHKLLSANRVAGRIGSNRNPDLKRISFETDDRTAQTDTIRHIRVRLYFSQFESTSIEQFRSTPET